MINEFVLDYWYIMLVVCGLYEGLHNVSIFWIYCFLKKIGRVPQNKTHVIMLHPCDEHSQFR